MTKFILRVGALACSVSACAGSAASVAGEQVTQPLPLSTDPVVLVGTVIDEGTNVPLSHALVQLDKPGSGYHRAVRSDSVGRFLLRIDSAGFWVVEAQHDGYILEQRPFYVGCGDGKWRPEGVSPNACPITPDPMVVRMRSWGALAPRDTVIRGRVLDERTGRPLQAGISLDYNSGALSSEVTGEYALPGLAPGVYLLEARAVGYVTTRRIAVTTCPDVGRECRIGGARVDFRMRPLPRQ